MFNLDGKAFYGKNKCLDVLDSSEARSRRWWGALEGLRMT